MKTLLLATALAVALTGCGQAPAANSDDLQYRKALGHAGLLAYANCKASRVSPAAVDMIKTFSAEASPAVKARVDATMLAGKRKFGNEFRFCAELEAALASDVEEVNDLAVTWRLMR